MDSDDIRIFYSVYSGSLSTSNKQQEQCPLHEHPPQSIINSHNKIYETASFLGGGSQDNKQRGSLDDSTASATPAAMAAAGGAGPGLAGADGVHGEGSGEGDGTTGISSKKKVIQYSGVYNRKKHRPFLSKRNVTYILEHAIENKQTFHPKRTVILKLLLLHNIVLIL